MNVIKPRLKALFLQGINTLQKKGIILDAEDTIWLYTLAENAIGKESVNDYFEAKIKIGRNLYLQPLTIGATIWLERYAAKWFANNPRKDLWSVAFAMANSDNKKLITGLTDRQTAWRTIRKFMFRNFFISETKLLKAVNSLLAETNYDYVTINENEYKVDATGWGVIVSTLSSKYGIHPINLLWNYSIQSITELIKNIPHESSKQSAMDNIEAFVAFKELLKYLEKKYTPNMESSVINL